MIYLDNAATTPICEAAKKAIIEHLDDFGNPSSSHSLGHKAKMLIEDARERIAKCINAEPDEIYFTSGGSEANSWAIRNYNTFTSNIEHHSIPSFGWLKVDKSGLMDIEQFEKYIKSTKHLVLQEGIMLSCMYANNEIGVIQPIKQLAEIAHKYNYLFHTDAVQTVGHIPIDVKELGVDMLSASGHKFGAPKGVGFLYIKNKTNIRSLIHGGKQEFGVRGGTENVLGIIAMAAALEDSIIHMKTRNDNMGEMQRILLNNLLAIDGVHLNGTRDYRVPSNINIRIDGVKGEDVVSMCDQYGICISAGSACNEGQAQPSHVLKAIGLTDEQALSSIRITLGYKNTFEEIEYVCDILPKIIERLRQVAD